MKRTVTAIYRTHNAANRTLERLMAAGFPRDAISLVMSKSTRARFYPSGPETGEGVTWGAGLGAVIGGLVGIAAAPTFGLFVAGPIAGMLAGAAGGGLLGALIELGVPEERARVYQSHIGEGGIVVAVEVANRKEAEKAEAIMLAGGDTLPTETFHVTEAHA